jgi:hypothetical protein
MYIIYIYLSEFNNFSVTLYNEGKCTMKTDIYHSVSTDYTKRADKVNVKPHTELIHVQKQQLLD